MANDPIVDMFDRMQVDDYVNSAAQQHGLDPALLHRLIKQESAYNPRAVSKAGAQGLMQLMPGTAKDMGVADSFDPQQNIQGGARYLASLMKRYSGDTNKALAAYNAGPGNVDSGRAASFPETQNYVATVGSKAPAAPKDPILSMWDEMGQPQAKPAVQPAAPAAKPQAPVKREAPVNPGLHAALQAVPFGSLLTPGMERGIQNFAEHPIDSTLEALPLVGGAIGGMFGGVPGAAAGGAAGKGYQDLGRNITELPGAIKDVVNNISEGRGNAVSQGFKQGGLQGAGGAAVEGAKQGAYELGGKVVSDVVLRPAARFITQKVFKPTAAMLEKAPNLAQTILDEGLMPTKASYKTAQEATAAARQVADDLVAKASSQPTMRFKPKGSNQWLESNRVDLQKEVIEPVFNAGPSIADPRIKNALGQAVEGLEKTPALRTADTMAENILKDNPSKKLTLEEVLAAKRRHGANGRRVFETDAPDVALSKQLNADLHNAADAALERRLGESWTEANAATQRRVGVQQAVKKGVQNRAKGTSVGGLRNDLLLGALGAASGIPGAHVVLPVAKEILSHPVVAQLEARGLNQLAKVPYANVARATEGVVKHKKAAQKKAKVDALYNRYLDDQP